ncbi:hypothetical protein ACFQU2_20900 [Siccirubricoccus deserti]
MRTPAPLMNPRVFANRGFAAAFAVALVYGASIFGTTYLIPSSFRPSRATPRRGQGWC